MWELGSELGFTPTQTARVTGYLDEEGLLRYRKVDGVIGITTNGIKKIKQTPHAESVGDPGSD